MRLLTGLNTGREGLVTNATAINVVADNIANSNTPGFKSERAEFADIFAGGMGGLYSTQLAPGNGALNPDIVTLFDQGPIDFTGRGLDAAVNGSGFFIVRDGEVDLYTRAGNFQLDDQGNLVTVTGESVMGFTEDSPTDLVPLNLANFAVDAVATTNSIITGNLNSDTEFGAPVANPDNFLEITRASQFNNSLTVTDSLGSEHVVAMHFFHTGVGEWTVEAYTEGEDVGDAAAPVLLGTLNLAFDGTGRQAEGVESVINVNPAWNNGAEASNITIDFSGLTQFASASAFSSVTIDGLAPGELTELVIEANGQIAGRLSNGENVNVGTLALADFVNIGGLERVGSNMYREDTSSGDRTVGTPTEGRFGDLSGGALELTNVDLAREFTDVIRFQRAYQANSSVVSTADELLNGTIQIA